MSRWICWQYLDSWRSGKGKADTCRVHLFIDGAYRFIQRVFNQCHKMGIGSFKNNDWCWAYIDHLGRVCIDTWNEGSILHFTTSWLSNRRLRIFNLQWDFNPSILRLQQKPQHLKTRKRRSDQRILNFKW